MPGEIEFLDCEPAPGRDEVDGVRAGRHRSSAIRRTRRVTVGLTVAALIGGALLARAATADGGSSAAALSTGPSRVGASYVASRPMAGPAITTEFAPSATLEVVPAAQLCARITEPADADSPTNHLSTRAVPRPRTAGATTPTGHAMVPPGDSSPTCVSAQAAACPESADGLPGCSTVQGLPTAVVTAVRERFPGASVVAAFTEIATHTEQVWYRSLSVMVDPEVSLDITVERSGNHPGKTGVRDYGDLVQASRAVHLGAQLDTIVEYAGQYGPVTLAQLSKLASDHRLATVS